MANLSNKSKENNNKNMHKGIMKKDKSLDKFYKAHSLYNRGDYDKALNEYDKAILLNPNNSDYYNGKGNALSKLPIKDDALKEYDKAIELNPKDPEYPFNKANLLHDMGWMKDDEAIAEYKKAQGKP